MNENPEMQYGFSEPDIDAEQRIAGREDQGDENDPDHASYSYNIPGTKNYDPDRFPDGRKKELDEKEPEENN